MASRSRPRSSPVSFRIPYPAPARAIREGRRGACTSGLVAHVTAGRTMLVVVILLLALPGAALAVAPGANGRIVFDSDHDGASDIYSVNRDGTGIARLTTSKAYESEASWSPGGRRIAYIRSGALWVMNADGSDQHRISHFKPSLRDPAWSPNGRRILFATDDGDNGDLWTIKPDGSRAKQLTNTRGPDEFLPSWSPD